MSEPENRLPARSETARSVPARNLSTSELEAVIRRAIELQSGTVAREEGISHDEVVRIAAELGLDAASVRHAIAEVRSRTPADQGGALTAGMGRVVARATRVLPRPAAAVAPLLDQYLREREFMVVQRRYPERTRYVRDSSLAAGMARVVRSMSRNQQPLDMKELDVAVTEIDADSCLVELSADLRGLRAGMTAGAIGSGGVGAVGMGIAIWATPVADPLMLLGLPLMGAVWYGMRAIYGHMHRDTEEKLESFLDRLEHGEL